MFMLTNWWLQVAKIKLGFIPRAREENRKGIAVGVSRTAETIKLMTIKALKHTKKQWPAK